jgi:transcription elongation factor Elf1
MASDVKLTCTTKGGWSIKPRPQAKVKFTCWLCNAVTVSPWRVYRRSDGRCFECRYRLRGYRYATLPEAMEAAK